MYVYIKSDDLGERFYLADKVNMEFVEQTPKEFISMYECYKTDLKESKGIRPWESLEKTKSDVDLSIGSENMNVQAKDGITR